MTKTRHLLIIGIMLILLASGVSAICEINVTDFSDPSIIRIGPDTTANALNGSVSNNLSSTTELASNILLPNQYEFVEKGGTFSITNIFDGNTNSFYVGKQFGERIRHVWLNFTEPHLIENIIYYPRGNGEQVNDAPQNMTITCSLTGFENDNTTLYANRSDDGTGDMAPETSYIMTPTKKRYCKYLHFQGSPQDRSADGTLQLAEIYIKTGNGYTDGQIKSQINNLCSFNKFTLTEETYKPIGTNILYDVSCDGGINWITGIIADGSYINCGSTTNQLMWKAYLQGTGTLTPLLNSLKLNLIITDPPIANAGSPLNGNEGELIDFDGTLSYDPNGIIMWYQWDFGDGSPIEAGASLTNPSHIYTDNGIYTTILKVRDNDGAWSLPSTTTATINNVNPIADANGPYSCIRGQVIFLNGSVTDVGTNDTFNFGWDMDNDATYETQGQNGLFNCNNLDGVYQIELKVTDDDSGTDFDTTTVTITPNDPPWINPIIPDQIKNENDPSWILDLKPYENDNEDSDLNLDWSVSGVDTSLITTSFDSTLDIITFTPKPNRYGINSIKLTLTDSAGLNVSQNISVMLSPLSCTGTNIIERNLSESEGGIPSISGDKIIWEEDTSNLLYLYDLSTDIETILTQDGSSDKDLAVIYGDKVVWQDNRYGAWDIYMYNISTLTETQLISDIYDNNWPVIYENKIVWQKDYRNGNIDIYLYDLTTSTETQITTSGTQEIWPTIYKNKIAWQDNRNGNWDIYIYDLTTSTETQITTSTGNEREAAIYETYVVWEDDRNGNWDIYMYDLTTSTETQITTSTGNERLPTIYGNYIVWQDDRNGPWNLYMYDLTTSTETQITTVDARYPVINQNKIVWYNQAIDLVYLSTILEAIPQTMNPIADLTDIQPTDEGELITFDGSLSYDQDGLIYWYKWDFGDGSPIEEGAILTNPTHTYLDDGMYAITLNVRDNFCSWNNITKIVQINNVEPIANANGPYNCLQSEIIPLSGSAIDLGTDDILTYNWDLDNDAIFESQGQNILFNCNLALGEYTINLKVDDDDGGTDINTTTVTINSNNYPWIDPIIPDQIKNEDDSSWILDLSGYGHDLEDSITELNWSVTEVNPFLLTITFEGINNEIIRFTPILNMFGSNFINISLQDTQGNIVFQKVLVTLNPVNDAPEIIPVIPEITGNEDQEFTFDLRGYAIDYDGDPLTWSISGVDPALMTATLEGDNMDIIRFTPLPDVFGSDIITIKVEDPSLQFDTQDVTINILSVNDPPIANIGPSQIGNEGEIITFNSISSLDIDGTIEWYEWDFGDGSPLQEGATLTSPTHTYLDNSIYVVSLRVKDNEGLWSIPSTTLANINNVAPIAQTNGPYFCVEGSNIQLNGSAIDPGTDDVLTYYWDLNNDATYEITGQNAVFDCNKALGFYDVTLLVMDDDIGIRTDTTTVEVIALDTTPPIVTINAPLDGSFQDENFTLEVTTDEITNCEYSLDGSAFQLFDSDISGGNLLHTHDLIDVSADTYSIEIKCTDVQDNPTTETVNVIVNCIFPTDRMSITTDTTFCPGVYNLTNGITIDSDNLLLDCNNAHLAGFGTGNGIYGIGTIDLNYWNTQTNGLTDITPITNDIPSFLASITFKENVIIKNCEISDYENGINITAFKNSQIINNTIHNNTLYGVVDVIGDHNLLLENDIHGNEDTQVASIGFGNNISTNWIRNGNMGIATIGWDNIIQDNMVGPAFEHGIVAFLSNNTQIKRNYVSDSQKTGIGSVDSNNAYIWDNTIYTNDNGIAVNGFLTTGTSTNTIINNNIHGGNNGILLSDLSLAQLGNKSEGYAIINSIIQNNEIHVEYTPEPINIRIRDLNNNGNIRNNTIILNHLYGHGIIDTTGNNTYCVGTDENFYYGPSSGPTC